MIQKFDNCDVPIYGIQEAWPRYIYGSDYIVVAFQMGRFPRHIGLKQYSIAYMYMQSSTCAATNHFIV